MIADFYDCFGEDVDKDRKIPQEILDGLNKELPSNLMYYQDENGDYSVGPNPDKQDTIMRMKTTFDISDDIKEKLKNVKREDWLEYFYRTQKEIPVKKASIGDGEKMIPLENTVGNPLNPSSDFLNARMVPAEFPEPKAMVFETVEGDKVDIMFQQQAHDSLTEIKFKNVNFNAIDFTIYVYSPIGSEDEKDAHTSIKRQMSATYSVTPTQADCVREAVESLHIFKGLLDGTVKVNGIIMSSDDSVEQPDPQKMSDMLEFWTTAMELEQRLGVTFVPSAEFPTEDVRCFWELDYCLNKNKAITWEHPFDSFHINKIHMSSETANIENMIGKEGMSIRCVEGPIKTTLLGTEFDIYSITELQNFVVNNIEWDDDTKQSGEVYITDPVNQKWILKRLFVTKDDERIKSNE